MLTIPENGSLLPLMEEFYTLQGEGYHSGKSAYFIRLGGCDIGCHWCDVKESWNAELHALTDINKIVEQANKYPGKVAVITGGEPLLYNLDPLTKALKAQNIQTFIETSGAYPLSGIWDWICLSPKKFKAPLPNVYTQAGELKIIIYNHTDFDWAEKHAQHVSPNCQLFLQPEWSKATIMLPEIIQYIKNNPQWRISLQSHKYMNIP